MKAAGRWAWWNQYGSVSLDNCVLRAREAKLDGVIVKARYWGNMAAFKNAGIPVAVEAYTYPNRTDSDAADLLMGLDRGAQFIVINAEHEWEGHDSLPMERLIHNIRERAPDVELYASVDTRGDRTRLPYQRVLADHITGWMPMVYPLAFRPLRPTGWIWDAFTDCLSSGQDFAGKPVLPTLQMYDGIGVSPVETMLTSIKHRELGGYQAYTIGHATDEEWAVIVKDAPQPEEDDMADEATRKQRAAVAGLFDQLAEYAAQGIPWMQVPEQLRMQLHYLLMLATSERGDQ